MTAVRPFASRLSRLWPALLLWFALATAGQARTVATIEELHAALASARGGETILLAPGRYERLSIGPRSGYDPSFPATVTVASADPGNPAAIGRMTLDGVANLTLQNLLFDYRFDPAHTHRERAFQILNSRNVAILDSELRGDIARNVSEKADGFGWGIGLGIRHSSGVRIERNTFHLWHRAMVVGRSQDVLVRENEIHSVRSDGMNFASVQRVLIEGNHIHSFRTSRTSGDHPDMIQFWTAGTERPTTDVVIRNNILNAGRGSFSQSIFMRNEVVDSGRAGREMFYRNIEIAGNVIINSHLHGITVGETEGLVIRNNTMLRSPYTATPPREGNIRFPTIRLKAASERVRVTGNLARTVAGPERRAERGGGADWVIERNLDLHETDASLPGHYDRVFLAPRFGDPATLGPFRYRPDGPADGVTLGASILRADAPLPPVLARGTTGSPARALMRIEPDRERANRFLLDATASRPAPGYNPVWSVIAPDGTPAGRAEGLQTAITLPAPGRWTIELSVGPDGPESRLRAEIELPAPEIVNLSEGTLRVRRGGDMTDQTDVPLATGAAGATFIRLGDGDEPARLPASDTRALREAHDLSLDLRLRADPGPDPSGTVVALRGTFGLAVTGSGSAELSLSIEGAERPVVFRTRPLALHDGQWHRIGLRHDATTGRVELDVNGRPEIRAQAPPGRLAYHGRHGLTFGSTGRGKSFRGALTEFSMKVNALGLTLH